MLIVKLSSTSRGNIFVRLVFFEQHGSGELVCVCVYVGCGGGGGQDHFRGMNVSRFGGDLAGLNN